MKERYLWIPNIKVSMRDVKIPNKHNVFSLLHPLYTIFLDYILEVVFEDQPVTSSATIWEIRIEDNKAAMISNNQPAFIPNF